MTTDSRCGNRVPSLSIWSTSTARTTTRCTRRTPPFGPRSTSVYTLIWARFTSDSPNTTTHNWWPRLLRIQRNSKGSKKRSSFWTHSSKVARIWLAKRPRWPTTPRWPRCLPTRRLDLIIPSTRMSSVGTRNVRQRWSAGRRPKPIWKISVRSLRKRWRNKDVDFKWIVYYQSLLPRVVY